MIAGVIILLILVLLSAFYSGSESALLSLNEFKIKHLVEKKKRNAELIEKLKSNPHRLLTTILIANNILNLSASALATMLALQYFEDIGPAISTGTLTFIILVFGEISPKALATNYPVKFSQMAAGPLLITQKMLFPLVIFFEMITKKLVKDKEMGIPQMSEEELKSIINMGEEEGSIEKEEKVMIHNIFELNDITVEEIMTPRNMMFALDKDMKLKDALPEILDERHSRIPLYDKEIDKIVGILYTKELINQLKSPKLDKKLIEFASEPIFIPNSLKINKLLNRFRKGKAHQAIIIDEYGGVMGLVTIEDVLEEIVGEIYDETDDVKVMITNVDDSIFLIDGQAEFEDVNKELKLKIKSKADDDFETISGFILQKLGKIPKQGEKIEFNHFDIIIEKVIGQKIEEIKIIKDK